MKKKMENLVMSDTDKKATDGIEDEFSNLFEDIDEVNEGELDTVKEDEGELDTAKEDEVLRFMGKEVLELCYKNETINKYFLKFLEDKQKRMITADISDFVSSEFSANSASIIKLRKYKFDHSLELHHNQDFLKELSEKLGFDNDFLSSELTASEPVAIFNNPKKPFDKNEDLNFDDLPSGEEIGFDFDNEMPPAEEGIKKRKNSYFFPLLLIALFFLILLGLLAFYFLSSSNEPTDLYINNISEMREYKEIERIEPIELVDLTKTGLSISDIEEHIDLSKINNSIYLIPKTNNDLDIYENSNGKLIIKIKD